MQMIARTAKEDFRSASGRGKGPNPVDEHVGARLRQCQTLLGFSQEKLGAAIGLTFQQV